jgi:hypothetical protein
MGGLLEELRVVAQDKKITITPSGFREGLHLPRQNIENLDDRRLKLLVWDEVSLNWNLIQLMIHNISQQL